MAAADRGPDPHHSHLAEANAALEKALARYQDAKDVTVAEAPPNLEDVFIQLQESAQ